MAVCFQVLVLLLMVYVKENVADETERPSYGCATLEGAKTINGEIEKLFQTVSLQEVAKPHYLVYVQVKYSHPLDACFPRKPKKYFSDTFYNGLATLSSYSKYNEIKLRAAESLKRNVTEIASTFKDSWMKVKKIFQMNQGIFEGLDIFFQDSLMQTSATIGSKAKNDTEANPNIIKEVINQLSNEFKHANALMKMMPRQILEDPARFQNNIVYSQVYSALANTVHKTLLPQDAAIVDHIKVFSEMSIKANIKKATKDLFDTYIRGFNDANNYAEITEDIVERLKIVTDRYDEVSVVMSCDEGRRIANELIEESKALRGLVNFDLITLIENFYRDIMFWFNKINSFEFLDQVRHALNFISPMVPQNVHPELDQLHSYVISRADRDEMPELVYKYEEVASLDVLTEGWFNPYKTLSEMLSKVIDVSTCYRKVFQFVGQTAQGCSDGVGSLREIYDEISSKIPMDENDCWSLSLFRRPSFDEIEKTVEKAAKHFGFNKQCEQNNQQDETGHVRNIVIDDYSDESINEKFSPSQRFTVCNLREKSLSDENINEKMDVRDLQKVKAVRCKPNNRSDSLYTREKQQVDN